MNWFWLRGRRCHGASAGGLPDGRAGQPTGNKTVRRIGCAWLSVVMAGAAAGCTGSPGSTGQGRAAPAASPSPVFISTAAPDAPVGRQLTWFLRAVAELPWPQQVIRAHFASDLLAQISPDELNSLLGQELAAWGASVPSSGASLTGLVWQHPTRDPVSLLAVAAFRRVKLTVNIAVDGAGLISVPFPLRPYLSSWAQADQELAALAPQASLLAARVSPGGSCTPVHQVAASAPRPLASMFKLFVLGALARQIAAGRISWDQELTVTDALKSAGNTGPGYLQDIPAGTRVPVRQVAAKMIALSDNTASDMLIHLVGRSAVEAQFRQWSGHAALNVPFLTGREAFQMKLLHYPTLADRYLSLAPGQRAAFLASAVDPLPFSPAQVQEKLAQQGNEPRDVDTIGWFASPDDICRAFAGLQQLAAQPRLAPLGPILSASGGGFGLDPARWPTVWSKGGSEPGVLTQGLMATNSQGQAVVVIVLLSNPAAGLSPLAGLQLGSIAWAAFELVR
jgi:Beta-lactamase enzyme family/ORF 12 gene product N-terminal